MSVCGIKEAVDFDPVNLYSLPAGTHMVDRWRQEWHLATIIAAVLFIESHLAYRHVQAFAENGHGR